MAAMAAINNMIRKYGALDAVFRQEQYARIPMAVVGIVMRILPDRHLHRGGHGGWLHPVVGFNMGSKAHPCEGAAHKNCCCRSATVGAVALVLVELLPRQLIAYSVPPTRRLLHRFCRRGPSASTCARHSGCQQGVLHLCEAMGKAAESTALSMVRGGVRRGLCPLCCPGSSGWIGVLLMPMSDILTFLIAGYLICKTYRELSTKGEV